MINLKCIDVDMNGNIIQNTKKTNGIAYLALRFWVADIYPHLGRVVKEDTGRLLRRMGDHEGDAAVEGHLVIQLVLKHVQVVEAVGVLPGTPVMHQWLMNDLQSI